jgi:N-acyl-D-aspartate/D-glutamate deacylase
MSGSFPNIAAGTTTRPAPRKLTGEAADIFGLVGRDYLPEDYRAEVCVFDPATVAPGPTKRVQDFPAGGERLTAEQPAGIRHVLVNGVPIRLDESRDAARGGLRRRAGHSGQAGGTQDGGRCSMKARIPSRGSGECSRAENMVW